MCVGAYVENFSTKEMPSIFPISSYFWVLVVVFLSKYISNSSVRESKKPSDCTNKGITNHEFKDSFHIFIVGGQA
jgi:hypothetical protein